MAAPTDESSNQPRPRRHRPETEHELFPAGASWLDLMPENAERSTRFVFACLESGILEAWQDDAGVVRLYLPGCCGGRLVVAGSNDDSSGSGISHCDLAYAGPNAHAARPGTAGTTLMPGIRRARTRPKPAASGRGPEEVPTSL